MRNLASGDFSGKGFFHLWSTTPGGENKLHKTHFSIIPELLLKLEVEFQTQDYSKEMKHDIYIQAIGFKPFRTNQ